MTAPDSAPDVLTGDLPRPPRSLPRFLRMIRDWLLHRVWYVHPGALVYVALSPGSCLHILHDLSRPRMLRLELGNLYAQGQRYNLQLLDESHFRMTVTRKVRWHHRRRTAPSAVALGEFDSPDESGNITRISLRAYIRPFYLLQCFLMPIFMTSIIIYMPWNRIVTGILIVLLFTLSWAGYRYNAAVEAHDMVFFIQKVLEKHQPEPIAQMGAGAHVVYEDEEELPDFNEAWERFYQQHRET